jgi:hypothetical protein
VLGKLSRPFFALLVRWCNGNTAPFGGVIHGSNPCRTAKFRLFFQAQAKGKHFDFTSVVPSAVPDDQNFAFSPVWIAEEKYLFQNRLERAKAWYGDRIYSDEVSKITPLLYVFQRMV